MEDDHAVSKKVIRNYKDLIAWQKARALAKDVYLVARKYPKEEMYGLAQQTQRAAVSVPSNIAEGYGRASLGDYVRFLNTARGSLFELETQLLIAEDLGYVPPGEASAIQLKVAECARLLQGLITSLTRGPAQ
jgi:four helix bundle protein